MPRIPSRMHSIAFEVPCILRGKFGRLREPRPIITTTRVVHEVREIRKDRIVFAYAVHLGTKSEGNTHFMYHDGGIFVTTRHHDTSTAESGWPENAYQAHTPLYARLWNDVLIEALAAPEPPLNVHHLVEAMTVEEAPDRREAWEALAGYSASFKPLPETKEDLELVAARVAPILDDLIVHRREILVRTGQPCYCLRIKGKTASVSIGNTEIHHRLRSADFTHPVLYPHRGHPDRSDLEVHYFPGTDLDGLTSFIKELGLNVPARIPKFYRFDWATHIEDFDGLELDRVARVAVHQVASMFRSQSMLALPDPLLRFDRAFFDRFMALRSFLEARHDPEETGDELWERLSAVKDACARPHAGASDILHQSTHSFLERALSRFGDRAINVDIGLPAGALPRSP